MRSQTLDPELLTCWKDIAKYMGKGVRTVQRWEQTLDLPVRRPSGSAYKSSVVARPEDLDVWLASRWLSRSEQAKVETTSRLLETGSLGSLIQSSRNLRHENHQLATEVRSALEALRRSCEEMARHTETTVAK